MISSDSPSQMTAQQRSSEISALFAMALLSLRQRLSAKLSIPLKQSTNPLEPSVRTRLNGDQSG
ncbi:MAG: hypothetical protein RL215_923 [Planctomycetota bacterium]|jgi:hypothetical protein